MSEQRYIRKTKVPKNVKKRDVQCFKCLKYGHLERECVTCSRCSKKGHTQTNCKACKVCNCGIHPENKCWKEIQIRINRKFEESKIRIEEEKAILIKDPSPEDTLAFVPNKIIFQWLQSREQEYIRWRESKDEQKI